MFGIKCYVAPSENVYLNPLNSPMCKEDGELKLKTFFEQIN